MDNMKKGKGNVRPKLRPESIGNTGESTRGVMGDQGVSRGMEARMPSAVKASERAKKKRQLMARQNSMVEAQEGMPSPADKNNSVGMQMGGKVPGYKAGKAVRGYGKARGGKACKML